MSSDLSKAVGIVIFGTLIISMLVETILSATWNKTYFTFGLRLFQISIPVNIHHANIPSKSLFEAQLDSIWLGSIVFKEISPNSYGFREKLFQIKLMRYTPVMHGLLIFDNVNSKIIVKGFADWYFLVFSLIWLSVSVFSSSIFETLFLIVFFILLMGLLYAIQSSRFSQIAKIAAEAWKRKHANNLSET